MDRPDLELVLAVRQHSSLVMAARALRVAPSAVTKRLAALETQLGLRLFQRTTRRVSPTAEGEMLCERAGDLLRAFDAVEADLREQQKEPAGPIRIAATLGFGRLWLGPVLADFQVRYPAVSIQLQLTEQLPDLAVEGFDGAIQSPGFRMGVAPACHQPARAGGVTRLLGSPRHTTHAARPDHTCLLGGA